MSIKINPPKSKKETRSHKFVEEMYKSHYNNPLNEREFVMKHKKGYAFFDMSPHGDDEAHLHYFRTHPRKSGIGSAALKELQGHAQRHGVKLNLTVGGHETPEKVLHKFYRKHGFKGHPDNMTWEPDKSLNEDAPTNCASSGMIAGIGIGPQGEPGRSARMMPLARRRADVLLNTIRKANDKKKKKAKKGWPVI